jgi:plastocyanin
MKRRTFVTAAGSLTTGGLVALSGCNAPTDGGGNGDENGEEQADGDETETTTTTEDEGTTTEETGSEETTTEGGGDTVQVRMVTEDGEYYFDPIGLSVEPGTTVEWVNEAGAHSATAYAEGNGGAEVDRIPEAAEPWNSETLTDEGATFTHTFEVEGTYDYFCIPHKSLGMVGRVVCGEPGGPAEGDMPPDGDVPESQTIVDQGEVSYDEFSG